MMHSNVKSVPEGFDTALFLREATAQSTERSSGLKQRLLQRRSSSAKEFIKVRNSHVVVAIEVWAALVSKEGNNWYTFGVWFQKVLPDLRSTARFQGLKEDDLRSKMQSVWGKISKTYGLAERMK